MFEKSDILKYKKQSKAKKIFSKKTLDYLKTYLNPYDFKEFVPLYVPAKYEEVKIIVKPLPFINETKDDIGGLYIPFSKHLSKDIKLNCSRNINEKCSICENSSIPKVDFVIFPAYIIKHTLNDYIKSTIKLIEVPLNDWNNKIEPFLEDYYKNDYILHIILNKRNGNYSTLYKNEKYNVEELTEDLVLKKCFEFDNIEKKLYNPKCYVKDFDIEINKEELIVYGVDF